MKPAPDFIRAAVAEDVKNGRYDGPVVEVRCTYDPETRGGTSADGRKVRGTIHWVCAARAIEAEVRLFDRLFLCENPVIDKERDFTTHLNPDALKVLRGCRLEPGLARALPGTTYQFERLGYFCVDSVDSSTAKMVFNRTVALRDGWARIERGQKG